MISVEVASTLYWLYGNDKEPYIEEKKKPAHASSTNTYKKVRLKIILKKSKQG